MTVLPLAYLPCMLAGSLESYATHNWARQVEVLSTSVSQELIVAAELQGQVANDDNEIYQLRRLFLTF